MALARVQYTADGSTDTFSVTFPYLKKGDVKVSVGGSLTTAYTWPTNGSIKLDSIPTSGTIIDIKRETEREGLLVDFQDGSTLLESDLDLSARQSFYLAQESYDQTGSSLAVAEDGSYSASERKISNLGDPTNPDEAAHKGYVDQVSTDGFNAHDERIAAEQARDAADTHASAASGHADDALLYRNTARTHRDDAKGSADSASASATEAALSETASQNSADSSESSATSASQSAAQADDLATQYAGSTVGFDASAYDFGFVNANSTYFNRDFGGLV